ncbi:MAG TPA: glycosyltransferase [Kofleriaceae bacterium]|nr:glycosyltransferase [Kofleriaceae bacterium]
MSRPRRLLVVSHTPHYIRDGVLVGWGPTVRELDQLATRFEQVRHVACVYREPAPDSALPYQAPNLEVVPVPPAGGEGVLGKLDALRASPIYSWTIARELRRADMVHVRAPANIALIAMALLGTRVGPRRRWFKYAGNWQPDGPETPSYRVQRWWLARGDHGGTVTVNGVWPAQPAWVKTFYNPSLSEADLERGRRAAAEKQLVRPIRLLFVGNVVSTKGAGRTIEILARLHARGIDATLELVGDGPERAAFEVLARERGVADRVRFLGWQPAPEVHAAYERAHVLVLPSNSEGWPKVLSEGMAFGVVPVASAVSSIPQYLAQFGTGAAFAPDEIDRFAATIAGYATDPARWAAESRRAVEAARLFSFQHYLASVDELLSA